MGQKPTVSKTLHLTMTAIVVAIVSFDCTFTLHYSLLSVHATRHVPEPGTTSQSRYNENDFLLVVVDSVVTTAEIANILA